MGAGGETEGLVRPIKIKRAVAGAAHRAGYPRAWNVGTCPQGAERSTAGSLWTESDYVSTKPLGGPLSPNTDCHDWKKSLDDAGVRAGRLYDARHTAATVLTLLGLPDRVIDQINGPGGRHVLADARGTTCTCLTPC